MKTKKAILVIGILVLTLFVSCNNQKKLEQSTNVMTSEVLNKNNDKATKQAKLKSSFVCYINNNYMGIEQIPVEVDGKIYYGCCDGCVDKLKNQRETRYAIDPLTGKEVDKATAFIVLKPNAGAAVLYFQSEENYLKYF